MSAEPSARFAARVAAAIFAGEALILLAISTHASSPPS
jgi:hypothetical protein